MTKFLISLVMLCALVGCGNTTTGTLPSVAEPTPIAQASSGRMTVERIDVVHDTLAYGNERGVYLITDTKTGQQFVGVSGIGISELGSHSAGKTSTGDER